MAARQKARVAGRLHDRGRLAPDPLGYPPEPAGKLRLIKQTEMQEAKDRVRRLGSLALLIVLVSLVAGVPIALLSIQGFQSPALPDDPENDAIVMSIRALPSEISAQPLPVSLALIQEDEASSNRNNLTAEIVFPTYSIGKQFKIILVGRATMKGLEAFSFGYTSSTALRHSVNKYAIGSVRKCSITNTNNDRTQCQIVSGVVPAFDSPISAYPGHIGVHDSTACDSRNGVDNVYSEAGVITMSGTGRLVRPANWANQTVTMPYGGWGPNAEPLQQSVVGLSEVSGYTIIQPTQGCAMIAVPDGRETERYYPDPLRVTNQNLTWRLNGGEDVPSVFFRSDYADALQNGGIVTAGLLFALASGFVPLWVDSLIE